MSPECLRAFCWIFITHLMSVHPQEVWTLLLIPPTLFLFLSLASFSTHLSTVALAFFLGGAWHVAFSGTLCLCHTLSLALLTPILKPHSHVYCSYLFCFNQPWTSRLRLLHHNHPRLFPNLSCFKSYMPSFRIIMRPLLERSVENKSYNQMSREKVYLYLEGKRKRARKSETS